MMKVLCIGILAYHVEKKTTKLVETPISHIEMKFDEHQYDGRTLPPRGSVLSFVSETSGSQLYVS